MLPFLFGLFIAFISLELGSGLIGTYFFVYALSRMKSLLTHWKYVNCVGIWWQKETKSTSKCSNDLKWSKTFFIQEELILAGVWIELVCCFASKGWQMGSLLIWWNLFFWIDLFCLGIFGFIGIRSCASWHQSAIDYYKFPRQNTSKYTTSYAGYPF